MYGIYYYCENAMGKFPSYIKQFTKYYFETKKNAAKKAKALSKGKIKHHVGIVYEIEYAKKRLPFRTSF